MPLRHLTSLFVAAGVLLVAPLAGRLQDPTPYRVVATDATRTLPVARVVGSTDMVALDVLVRFFDLAMREDARTRGVVVSVRSQRVVLTAGQATVSAAGRLVSLSAPVIREDGTWLVPIDFLRVLDPLLRRRIDIRRASRLIVLDDAPVPQVTLRFDRTATGGRLTVGVEPGTTSRVTREGSQITMRFQAAALDVASLPGLPPEFLAGVRADGPSLLVDLGPGVTNVREDTTRDSSRISLELIGEPTTLPPTGRPDAAPPSPTFDRTSTIRTVVIDPGHGGPDVGRRGTSGVEEKQITLAVAQRLKTLLESRLGVRVLLTRDGDTAVPIDRRAALANNNKADLFISLHANGSPMSDLRGWQIQSLDPADYGSVDLPGQSSADATAALSVPVVGGGTRLITTVPWTLAQIPFADRSNVLAQALAARFAGAGLVSQPTPLLQGPLRVLVGANMPAVLIELGLLSNADDAALLSSAAFQNTVTEIITAVVSDLRDGVPAAPAGGTR